MEDTSQNLYDEPDYEVLDNISDDELEKIVNDDPKKYYEGAVLFNDMDYKDQISVINIYNFKKRKKEFGFSEEDSIKDLEEVARLFYSQKCAFQDVLTKEGFEPTTEVSKYETGRVAALTVYGTLVILGKPKQKGRHIYMTRLHSPDLNITNQRGEIYDDTKIGEKLRLIHSKILYTTSNTIGLATNPRGADGDELEAATQTHLEINTHIMKMLSMPSEVIKEYQK